MTTNSITQEALPTVVGITYFTYFAMMPPDIVMGAFAGSVIFLLGVNNKPKWQWIIYFLIAFLAGLMGADAVTQVLEGILGIFRINVTLSKGLGAMFSAACTINIISWFRDNATLLIKKKGGLT